LIYEFIHEGNLHSVSIERHNEKIKASVHEKDYDLDVHRVSDNCISILLDSNSFIFYIAEHDNEVLVYTKGEVYTFELPDIDKVILSEGVKSGETKLKITAPMPGQVLKINVKEKESVVDGQCLAIVEAMKMETELFSRLKGKVKKVHVREGQQVDAGELLLELEKEK
jgi:biotin carboxyl carrier protein